MFDFQTQTISTSLVFAGDDCVSVDVLAEILKSALNESDDAVIATQTDMLDGVTIETATLTLRAGWHHGEGEQQLALSIGSETGSFGENRAQQIRMTRILRHVLDALPVAEVEWLDTGVRIPAARFRAALEPVAKLSTKVTPRRVARRGRPAATRLTADEARKVVRAAERPADPLPSMKVAPRRVSVERPAEARRLSQDEAARITARVPEVTEADRIVAMDIDRPQQDAHVQDYEMYKIADLRRDATPEEIEALRMETESMAASGLRLAASLLLGLTGATTITQSSETMASVLGAS